jgi:TonB-dependent receptor
LVPDGSVADSLTRQKNLNFSGVRIDGEKTDVALTALSAEQILSAVATKVPTPDLDADAIGGELQLTSRRAFEQKEPTLRGSAAGSYDPLAGKPMPDASITYGRSFGARKQFGFLATLEHAEGRDGDEDIELDWNVHPPQLKRFDVSDTREASTETNFNGTADWRWGDKGHAFIRSEVQFASERIRHRRIGYDFPALALATSTPTAAVTDATLRRSVAESRVRNRALTLAAGANVTRDRWLIELRLTHRAAREKVPDERNYDFAKDDLSLLFQHREPGFPTVTSSAGIAPGNAAQQDLREIQWGRGSSHELDDVASIDLTRAPAEGSKLTQLKFGGKARLQRTTQDQIQDIYEPAGTPLRVSDAMERRAPEHILARRYIMEGFPDLDTLRSLLESEPNRFFRSEAKSRSETDPANFDVRQNILAAYGMVSFPVGETRFVIGARAEHTASRFRSFEVSFDEQASYEGTRSVAARSDFTHLFPGIHASHSLSKNVTLFASWTRSIRRPAYTDVVPARRITRFDRTIEEGNAALRPALYSNYDAAIDYAYRDDGTLSLEVFHREIRDPTLTRRTFLIDGPYAGYERIRPENGGNATLRGLQLTWRQELAAISPRLTGLGFEINYTHQRSQQSVDNRLDEKLSLTERPTHELAVLLSYDRSPYYVSVDFTQTGRTLESVGLRPGEDIILPTFRNWDVTISREFRKGLRVFLEIENVTATPDRTYTGDPSRPRLYSLDLREYRLGMKWGL